MINQNKILLLLLLFLIGGFIGSVLDTSYRSIVDQKFVHKSFLGEITGLVIPFMPVYGIGLIIIYLLGSAMKGTNVFAKFIVYAIVLGLLELIAGIFTVSILGAQLWDYSQNFLNILGHVDLLHSVYWGVLGLLSNNLLGKFLRCKITRFKY